MNLVDRAKNIIMTPKTEWPVIASEEANLGGIITGYVIPLALIPTIAVFIGYGFVGVSVLWVTVKGIDWGIVHALQTFLGAVIGTYLSAFVIDALAPSFGSQKNLGRAAQLVAFSYTPSWVAGVFNIYPPLAILSILAGIWGLYIMYLGFPSTMQTPKEKVVGYMIVSIIVIIIIAALLGWILNLILFGIFALNMPTASFNF